MNKLQILLLGLIVALIVNTISHFVHPAYRRYNEVSADLVRRYDAFRSQVVGEFIPAVNFAVSNSWQHSRIATVVTNVLKTSGVATSGRSSDAAVTSPRGRIRYAFANGQHMVVYHHFHFVVGDSFMGDKIVAIDPTCFITTSGLFAFDDPDQNLMNGKGAENVAGTN